MNSLTFILVPLFLLTGSATSLLLRPFPVINGSNGLQTKLNPRIVHGLNAVKGQFPWQAFLEIETPSGNFACGGSLISSRWVLTAAHCVQGAQQIEVHLGIVDFEDYSTRVIAHSTNFVSHDSYSSQLLINDIAAVYLSTPVTFSEFIRPITISSNTLHSGVEVTVSGWGLTSDYSSVLSQYLNYAPLTTITNLKCASTFGILILFCPQRVCAQGDNIQSACNGDSGGPLITGSGDQAELVGIVSFRRAEGCAKGYPSGYVRTAYFRDWIQQKTGI